MKLLDITISCILYFEMVIFLSENALLNGI